MATATATVPTQVCPSEWGTLEEFIAFCWSYLAIDERRLEEFAGLEELITVGLILQALTGPEGDVAFCWLNRERTRRQLDAEKARRQREREKGE